MFISLAQSVSTGFEGSVSQGKVYIKFTFNRFHQTTESIFTKQKYTIVYLHTCYSTGFHISVMQEHSEFLPYQSINQPL